MTSEDRDAKFIKCFKDNNFGQLLDMLTKRPSYNYYDNDSQRAIFIDSSIEMLSMFLRRTCINELYFSSETIIELITKEKIDRIKLMFEYYPVKHIMHALCDSSLELDWCLKHGYITKKNFAELIYGRDNHSEIFLYAHERGLIDHYDILLHYMLHTDDGTHKDVVRIKSILNNCSHVDHDDFRMLLDWNCCYKNYAYILTDRKIFPKIDDYIEFFDTLSKVMNCYEAYTLTELYTMLSPDKWDIMQQNKMISIWPSKNKDILSSKRLMSLYDIDVTTD